MVNWHPRLALQHVLHYSLEATGQLLTYQSFREFCREDAKAMEMLLVPAREQ
jgi:hypothetical protein